MSQTAQTYMKASEAAGVLGVSVATVKRMAADGRLPHVVKVPGETGAYLFDPAVVQLVAQQKKAS